MPKGEAKQRTNIRLSDKQKEIVYIGLDKSLGIQTAIDELIEFKRKHTQTA